MGQASAKKPVDLHPLLLKLERQQHFVQKFAEKLGSYTCEPTDYKCFMQVGRIRSELTSLLRNQKRILERFRSSSNPKEEYLNDIEQLFKKFATVEQDIAAYILATNQHQ